MAPARSEQQTEVDVERADVRQRFGLLVILAVAAAGRLLLALVVYPGVGFAGDMDDFIDWAHSFAQHGPASFYANDSGANYPPLAIVMLAGLDKLSGPASAVLGGSSAHALVVLIKLPSVLADVVTTGVVYLLGRDLRRPAAGLVAAALFAVVPPIWFVSALWGQIDSVLIMFSMLALLVLCRRHYTLAAVAAGCALMIKPQGVLVVLVVVVVAAADLLGRGSEAVPRAPRVPRLVIALGIPAILGLGLLTLFDYRSLAGPDLTHVPILGDLAGFYAQSVSTGKLFPVLTANAYNVWALVGNPPLASTIGTGRSVWLLDASPLGGVGGVSGLSYSVIGLAALLVAAILVVVGLIIRRDRLAILFGYTVLSYAFYAFPTRVHERYLLPTFATAAVLVGLGVLRAVAYLFAGLLNLINLNAVLAAPLGIVTRVSARTGVRSGRPPGGLGGINGGSGQVADSSRAGSISLPWSDPARAEEVVRVVAIAQAGIAVLLLLGWLVFGGLALRTRAHRARGHRR